MEDKIFDLITDLQRDDISKQDCIDALLLLCNSCEKLKDKYTPTFEYWLEYNKIDHAEMYKALGMEKSYKLSNFFIKMYRQLYSV